LSVVRTTPDRFNRGEGLLLAHPNPFGLLSVSPAEEQKAGGRNELRQAEAWSEKIPFRKF
jgi:hypothetical protein